MWEPEVVKRSSPSPPPPPPPSSSSSSWNMKNLISHHPHSVGSPAPNHPSKHASMTPPSSVPHPLPPHLNSYKLIKALGHGSMGTVFLGLSLDNPPPSHDPKHDDVDRNDGAEKLGEDDDHNDGKENHGDGTNDGEQKRDEGVNLHMSSHGNGLYALKVMSKEEIWRKGVGKRASMEREVLMACSGVSPFLPSLKAHFESDTHQVLVIDYCSGGDLNQLRSHYHNNRFSEEDARFYAVEILLALEKLHEVGFVYRDLKPENVLVRSNGHVMLADFDLCLKLQSQPPSTLPETIVSKKWKKWVRTTSTRIAFTLGTCVSASESTRVSSSATKVTPVLQATASSNSRTGRSLSFVGTEEYVAPEILWGTGHDLAVDWWTLGVLLFDLVCGTTPFKSLTRKETFFNILCKEPKLDSLLPAASPQFVNLISRLLAKQPSDRLGFLGDAQEIKSHPFFDGIDWDSHHEISIPPYIPSPRALLLDCVADNGAILESQLAIAEHRRILAQAGARNQGKTHHNDFQVF